VPALEVISFWIDVPAGTGPMLRTNCPFAAGIDHIQPFVRTPLPASMSISCDGPGLAPAAASISAAVSQEHLFPCIAVGVGAAAALDDRLTNRTRGSMGTFRKGEVSS